MTPIKIIYAEDQQLLRTLLCKEFAEANINVIAQAENGIELLDYLKTMCPDVILLDISMPKMCGITALTKLMELYPTQKVVMLSMYAGTSMMDQELRRLGAKAILPKNTLADEIINVIREVFDGTYEYIAEIPKNGAEKDPKITKAEKALIPHLCAGKSNKEIASILNIVEKTVEAHKSSLRMKTGTYTTAGLVGYLVFNGLNHLS